MNFCSYHIDFKNHQNHEIKFNNLKRAYNRYGTTFLELSKQPNLTDKLQVAHPIRQWLLYKC